MHITHNSSLGNLATKILHLLRKRTGLSVESRSSVELSAGWLQPKPKSLVTRHPSEPFLFSIRSWRGIAVICKGPPAMRLTIPCGVCRILSRPGLSSQRLSRYLLTKPPQRCNGLTLSERTSTRPNCVSKAQIAVTAGCIE